MTYDITTFFNELDLLELRLNILDRHVDKFIITEAEETFSGFSKPLYYAENKERFTKWNDKIIHNIVGRIEAVDPFIRAAHQKNSALALIDDPEALIYFGDTDEIWTPQTQGKIKLRQYNYCYYLNERSSEDWYGTVVGRRKDFTSLTDARETWERIPSYAGWHFTNMGGIDQIIKKTNSYDHAHELNHNWIKDHIQENIEKGLDYLGRPLDYQGNPFKFWIEEDNWPQYLKDNKHRFLHLCK